MSDRHVVAPPRTDRTTGQKYVFVQDILRFGPEVEVVEPPALHEAVARRLARALERY